MEEYVWIVCYIDITEISSIESNLAKKYRRYMDIEAYVPTIRVLDKTFKKRDEYKDVPLLMNYGFFKVPKYFIYNDELLKTFKFDVKAIFQFLKNPEKEKLRKKKNRKVSVVATVSEKEIKSLMEVCKSYSVYSESQVNALSIGQIITLKTYPFENVMVEIVELDRKKKQAKVQIISEVMTIAPTVTITFDHLFYTIYNENNLVTPARESSLDEMRENGYSIDNLFFNE